MPILKGKFPILREETQKSREKLKLRENSGVPVMPNGVSIKKSLCAVKKVDFSLRSYLIYSSQYSLQLSSVGDPSEMRVSGGSSDP